MNNTIRMPNIENSQVTWRNVTLKYIKKYCNNKNSSIFTRQDFISTCLPNIVEETNSDAEQPGQSLSRTLQNIRDKGIINFIESGVYELIDFKKIV